VLQLNCGMRRKYGQAETNHLSLNGGFARHIRTDYLALVVLIWL